MSEQTFVFKSDNKDSTDDLGRKNVASLYVKFINALDGHHVIALDAPWGSGKSTLIDYMCKDFEENKDIFVKYNAWENDYTEEPLLSLMSDLNQQFQVKKYIGKDDYKSFVPHMVKATKLFTKGVLKGVSKVILGTEATTDIGNACIEVSSAITDEVANNIFKDIDESKKSRKEFKEELKQYTNQILKEKEKEKKGAKLIIIIDELDRCRPTFAIELLENIKHLFDIENIVFFIAVDNKQLAESIRAVYGNGFDADTYLHRFFDFELHLKRDSIGDYFYKKIKEKFINYFPNADNFAKDSSETFNLTIRDINKIVNEAFILNKLFNQAYSENDTLFFPLKIFLLILILKYKNQDLYLYFKETKATFNNQDLINKFGTKTDIKRFMETHINLNNDEESISLILKTIKRIEETL
ncbi:KAP family P-loop NTPase fold protein [Aliarcobacter lanthieri]|uniref:KAP family P-loop NTPase fold protein n=1 Tax=Aliarcobacter lanthieri TaxID=1355374 RepID=UPI00047A021C|nr:P-loop NTPase fold protein [Aliarcobacter lanthieri]